MEIILLFRMLSSIILTLVILPMAEPLLRIIQIQHAQEILIEIDLEDASGGMLAKTNVSTH